MQSRVAIVHEWLEPFGGAELVVDEWVKMFPHSDLFMLWCNDPDRFKNQIYESFLSRSPLRGKKAASFPLHHLAWKHVADRVAKTYDKALISSHVFAHHVVLRASPDLAKYVYVHSPARFLWDPKRDPRGDRALLKIVGRYIKPFDRKIAQAAHSLVANSLYTQAKIKRFWEVGSEVIYPPVNVLGINSIMREGLGLEIQDELEVEKLPEVFILGASRFVGYKKLDRVIEIGNILDIPVVLAGSGPQMGYLEYLAKKSKVPVRIIWSPSNSLLLHLYSRALAYVFPPEEDFGIMPVEAVAAGASVVANFKGGASETIVEGLSGFLVDIDSDESIIKAFENIEKLPREGKLDSVLKFDSSRFTKEIGSWLNT